MLLAIMTIRITRTGDANCTRLPPALPTMDMAALTLTTTSLVLRVVAISQWTALEPGIHMEHASTLPSITRTGDADSTRSAPTLPTMDMVALTQTTTSLVLRVVAVSQWTVLEPGLHMLLVSMTIRITRTEDADCTRSAPALPTMDLSAVMPTTTSLVLQEVAVSQWTVLELGIHIHRASTSQVQVIRITNADFIRSVLKPNSMDMNAAM